MFAEFTILAIALAAFVGAPLWAIVPAAFLLLAIFIFEQRKSIANLAASGTSEMLMATAWVGLRKAFLASGIVYGVGALARLSLVALLPT